MFFVETIWTFGYDQLKNRSCQGTYNSGMTQGKNLVIHKGIHGKRRGKVKFLDWLHMWNIKKELALFVLEFTLGVREPSCLP